VIAVAKSADLVLMVLDALREREQHHKEVSRTGISCLFAKKKKNSVCRIDFGT
jgi:ribosome-interacting GTPase 1